jgi:hypothetical protein
VEVSKMIYVYYITLFAILFATINFNKTLIDNVFENAKEQKEWHYAQLFQWVVVHIGITLPFSFLLGSGIWYHLGIFGCFYPTIYDLGLNLRRGEDWNKRGVHDLPVWLKIVLIVIGSILTIWK